MNDQSRAQPKTDESAATTTDGAAPPLTRRRRQRMPPFLIPVLTVLVLMIAVAIWGGRWYLHQQNFVEETNARIDADLTAIASRVDGWVTKMPATEGDRVATGALLAQIDDRQAHIRRGSWKPNAAPCWRNATGSPPGSRWSTARRRAAWPVNGPA